MKSSISIKTRSPQFYLGLICLIWLLSTFASMVFAEGVNDALAPYRDFRPSEDMATRVMEGLLGPTYTSPLTAGIATNTLFGAIFLVFNVVVFAVGTVWASYGVIAGIVQTAHEGVVLGRRMNAIWMPVRMVTGIGSLVPAFGGFSLSQVVMILATSWGISFANFAYDKALQMANTSATLVNASFSRVDPQKDANALAFYLYKQRKCELAYERKDGDNAKAGVPTATNSVLKPFPFMEDENRGTVVGRAMGTEKDHSACYAIGLQRKTYFFGLIDKTGRSDSSAVGFRSGAVNYDKINQQAWEGYVSNFSELVSRVRSIADQHQAALDRQSGEVPDPTKEIRAAGVWFGGAVQTAGINQQNISAEALANMGKYGFFAAGSYYSTHAEVNAAVIQAADATEFIIIKPKEETTKQLSSGDYNFDYGTPEATAGAGDGVKRSYCLGGTNDTGNCSFGQKLVSLMLDAGTAGSGGSSSMLDPIIALKNIGDYMMTIGEGILAASLYVDNGGGAGASVVSGATEVLSKASPVAAFIAPLLAGLKGVLPYIGGLMFAVGALCAIYMPMVPFINWVSGLVQYCCIVVESFAAAPLWAFAHLQADGEGMGQRTERGYLYILNLLFRPILMVVAFFAASALVILLGSVVFQMFMPAMAAAQGNSVTGIFSAIGYVFLFFVILNIIIQGLFHLVMELADDAIGWVGGIGRNNIGRDTEGKVNQMFMMGGRFGAGGVDKASTAANMMAAGKSARPGGAAGGAGAAKIGNGRPK